MSNAFGCEAKTFVNATPDQPITGTGWLEAKIIRNVTCNDGKKEVDVTNRSCGGYEQTDCYFDQPAVNIDIPLDPASAAFVVLETAYSTQAPISAAVLGGPSGTAWAITASAARGPVGTWTVTQFEIDRNVTDIQRVKVTIKPLRNMSVVAPQPPSGVSAALINGCIDVYFTNNANHDGFNVYYSTNNGNTFTQFDAYLDVGSNWIRFMNETGGGSSLPPGTYVFRLTSGGDGWESRPSPTTNSVTI
jgi:hypothetical protein